MIKEFQQTNIGQRTTSRGFRVASCELDQVMGGRALRCRYRDFWNLSSFVQDLCTKIAGSSCISIGDGCECRDTHRFIGAQPHEADKRHIL